MTAPIWPYVADAESATLFHHIFEKRVAETPLKRAVLIDGRSATYEELDAMGDRVASWLRRLGLPVGTHVAVSFHISVEAVAAVLGIWKAGCALVTNHPGFSEDKLVQQVVNSESRALITDRDDVLQGLLARTGLTGALLIGAESMSLDAKVTRFGSLCDEAGSFIPDFAPNRAMRAAIFHTTGSTFSPKGVVITHGNMLAAFHSITSYLKSTPYDVILHYASFSFDFGIYNTIMPILFGGSSIASRSIPDNPEKILATIEQEEVTALHFMPPVVFQLCKAERLHPGRIPSVRYLSSTGQRLPSKSIRQLRKALPHVAIFSMYGMNEATRVLYLPPSEIDHRPTSVGKAIPGVRTYLVSSDGGLITKPDHVGELAVAGDLVMQGYWDLPEYNARVFRDNVFGEKRVFLTGDLFRMDDEGYFYYVARKDDVFTRNMFQVNPKEIEEYLLSLDGVAEAVVVPIPDPGAGHVPKAYVVPFPGVSNLTERDLIDACARRLDWHMVPTAVEIRYSLPRTESGKTQIRGLDTAVERAEPALRPILNDTAMSRLAAEFDDLATGRRQVPRIPVRTELGHLIENPSILAYHDLLTAKAGPLFSHFLASIPYILEELCRVGVAVEDLSRWRDRTNDRPFTFYEADAFDGSNGRALNHYSQDRIATFTNSPNPSNESYFRSFVQSNNCVFFSGSFLEIDRRLLVDRDEFHLFREGFDVIYETATFQFYGRDRDRHVRHIANLLRPDGVIIFMHKLGHANHREFEERELMKDQNFKTKYFDHDEILWKRQQMLDQMHTGLITIDETRTIIKRHFRYVSLIWNSSNFHEILASNDAESFERILAALGKPIIPEQFCYEKLGAW